MLLVFASGGCVLTDREALPSPKEGSSTNAGGVIEVDPFKIYKESLSCVTLDMRVKNISSDQLRTVIIDVEFYDTNSKYMGKTSVTLHNLSPYGGNVESAINCDKLDLFSIATFEFFLIVVDTESPWERVTTEYKLVIK